MRFSKLKSVKLRLLKILHSLIIVMLRKILLGHGLIVDGVRPICKVLQPLFEFSLSLCIFQAVELAGRSLRGILIELILVRGFISGLVSAEVEVGLTQLLFHILVQDNYCLYSPERSGASALVGWVREVGVVRGLLGEFGFGVSDVEVLHFNGLSDFFVHL
jgi:hypothetical protein